MRSLALLAPVLLALALAAPALAQDDHSNVRSSAATLIDVDGALVPGEIEVRDDRDWFRFRVTAGVIYTVFTVAQPGMDVELDVYSPQGAHNGNGDKAGDGSAFLEFTAWTTGTWYARVTHGRRGTGRYAIGVAGHRLARPPRDLAAQATGATRVVLTWTDWSAPGSNEDGFEVERCVVGDAAYTTVVRLAANTTTYTDLSAVEGAAADYRVVSTTGTGRIASNLARVTTPPAAPTNLRGTAATTTQVDLTWTDVSTRETGYRLERQSSGTFSYTTIAHLPADATSYSDATAPANTQHHYRLYAVGPGGESAPATLSTTSIVVPAPIELYTRHVAPAHVELRWLDRSTNEDGFRIERRLHGTVDFSAVGTTPADLTRFVDTTTQPDTRYDYRVVAFAGPHDSPPTWTSTVQVGLPGPTDLLAAAAGPARVLLAWVDHAADEGGFRIERRIPPTWSWAGIGATAADVTVFEDTTAQPGTTYEYRVRAFRGAGHSPYCEGVILTIPATTPPATPRAPDGLRAVAGGPSLVGLTWRDRASDETGYRVERRPAGGGAFAQVALLPADAAAHTDDTASPGATYDYRVVALCPGGDAASGVVSVTTPRGGLLVNGDFEAGDLRGWTTFGVTPPAEARVAPFATVNGVVSSALELSGVGGGAAAGVRQTVVLAAGDVTVEARIALHAPQPNPTGGVATLLFDGAVVASRTFNGPLNGQLIRWTLRRALTGVAAGAHEVAVRWERQGSVDATTPRLHVDDVRLLGSAVPVAPGAPTGLRVVSSGPTGVELAWTDASSDEAGFRIERSPAGGVGFAEVGQVAANVTRFTDATPVAPGHVREYRVVAVGVGPDSAPSNVAATPAPAAPAAPTDLQATTAWLEVRLGWTDASLAETGFRIERRSPGGSFADVGLVAADTTSFTDAVPPGVDLEYRVVAVNDGGEGASSVVAVTTVATPPVPVAPDGLVATVVGPNRVDLAWNDRSTDEVGFRIERRLLLPALFPQSFEALATVAADVTTYSDPTAQAGSEYDYRVVALGAAGGSLPSDLARVRTTTLLHPIELQAPVVAPGWVEVTWRDRTTTETGFRIERRLGHHGPFTAIGAVGADVTRFVDRTAPAATDVFYQVVAETLGGESAPSSFVRVGTPAPPPPPPARSLRAVATAPFTVELAWTDHATDEAGYRVERRRADDGFQVVATLPPDATGYTDGGLTPDRTYEYRVRPFTAGGPAPAVETVAVTTPRAGVLVNGDFEAGDLRGWTVTAGARLEVRPHDVDGDGTATQALVVSEPPVSLAQTVELVQGDVDLELQAASSSRKGIVTLLLDGRVVDRVELDKLPGQDTRATLRGRVAVAAGLHEVRISVHDLRQWDTVYLDDLVLTGSAVPAPPPAPTALGITAGTATRIDLAWGAAAGATGYRVQRSILGDGFVELGRTAAGVTRFSDPTVQPGRVYQYRVLATSGAGHSPPSNVVQRSSLSRPAAPANLAASTTGAALVTLTWTDRSTSEVGFVIERRSSAGGAFALLGVVGPNVTSFLDAAALPLSDYDYRVLAFNDSGESAAATVSVTTGTPPPAPAPPMSFNATSAGAAGVLLTWTPGTDPDTGYRIVRDFEVLGVAPAGAASFVDATAEAGRDYGYLLYRVSAGGEVRRGEVRLRVGSRAPGPMTDLRADALAPDRVLLRWADAEREGGYLVERRTGGGAFEQVVALGPDATAWLDAMAAPGTTHEWRVTATSPHGDGAQAAVSATTPPAGVLFNGDFEAGDLRGWTRFGPPGARVETTFFDVDGDGRSSWALVVKEAGHGHQVGVAQEVRLADGALELEVWVDVTSGVNTDGGEVSLVFDGLVVGRHHFVSTSVHAPPQPTRLRATLPHVTAGTHEVRLMVQRGPGTASYTPWLYFDDLRLWGSAVPSRPAAPDALAAARASTGVRLTWVDRASDEVEFRIERSPPGGGAFVEVGRAPRDATSFVDVTAAAGTPYEYRVFATNEGGDSATAAVVTAP
ncbi:MAG: hypothetical protein M9894_36805 [Planctomycetes bacterium]|nr:hypothetical protein [Planctomycetota bacterium]